jgi:tetratricopeptide (TPR) repeat protein
MKRILLPLLLALPATGFAACPPVPDTSNKLAPLMEAVREAPDEATARDLNNGLWKIWTTAPDAAAQEMLDRGMSRRGVFDFVNALQDFDALIAYCPHYAEGYNQRAFVHFLREDYEAAMTDLVKTLEITPDHIGAASGLALTLLELGNEEAGQAALRYALSLNPWLPERFRLKPAPGAAETDSQTEL